MPGRLRISNQSLLAFLRVCLCLTYIAKDRCDLLGRDGDSTDFVQTWLSDDKIVAFNESSTDDVDAMFDQELGGEQARNVKPSRSTIPTIIWVTGKWSADSKEVEAIARNLNDVNVSLLKHKEGVHLTKVRFAQWAPRGTRIYYFSDTEMTKSVAQISKMLEDVNVTDSNRSAVSAYFNLRPGAFRADLWRLLVLWAYGGVYLDSNLRLKKKLENWISFTQDELVFVEDSGAKTPGYWNAMMAAAPRNVYMEKILKTIVNHIHDHYYGDDPLAVTGPIALFNALEQDGLEYKSHLRLELKFGQDKKVVSQSGEIVAEKDEGLHDTHPTTYYADMWRGRHMYCDEPAPRDTRGLCGITQAGQVESEWYDNW